MFHKAICALCGCLLYVGLFAQSKQIDRVLQSVTSNNKELKALRVLMESQRANLATQNRLPDLKAGVYYLPFGVHSGSDYTEYQVTQSVEFPTVYAARKGLIDRQESLLHISYQDRLQEILSEAKRQCLQVMFLTQKITITKDRVSNAQRVLNKVEALYKKDEASVLTYNKAKIIFLQEKYTVQELETEKESVEKFLVQLNGGNSIELTFDAFEYNLQLPPFDTLWSAKVKSDPRFNMLAQKGRIAEQSLKVIKHQNLPNITAGYNSQGIAGERFSGVYAGLSIPLWNNRKKVQSAQYELDFQKAYQAVEINKSKVAYKKRYDNYQIELQKFEDYQSTLQEINSSKLLLEAYQLGEMSFMDYYGELQFYQEAYDTMLEIQHELYNSQVQLLKHKLLKQ